MHLRSVSQGNRNKSKHKQMGPNQLIDFSTAEELINKMKRQPTGGEKTIANHVTDKGSISSQINNCSQKKMRSFRSALIQRQILLRDGKLDTETHGADNTLRRQTDTEGAWPWEDRGGDYRVMLPRCLGLPETGCCEHALPWNLSREHTSANPPDSRLLPHGAVQFVAL